MNQIKKAVILAAGEGKRLLPFTSSRPKHLLPLAGKPLLQYTIEYLKDAGITDVLLIVGYLKEKIMDYFGSGANFGLNIHYVEQKEFLGTANAAGLAENFAQGEPFMLIYGDLLMDKSIFKDCISAVLELYSNNEADKNAKYPGVGVIALFQVPDPQKFGIIQLDANGFVKTIVEKPQDDRYGNLANAGVFVFDKYIFQGIAATPESPRGEYELTDSMQILVDSGYKIKGLDISGRYWSDVGHPWQLLDANKHMLDLLESDLRGNVEPNVTIKGNVYIGNGTVVKAGTYIEGPVFIGENVVIGPNAFIRPYSSIGDGCRVGNSSETKNSIVLQHSYLSHLSYIGDSIIGENVNFGCGTVVGNVRLDKKEVFMTIKGKRVSTGRKKMGAAIGDNVQLGINVLVMGGKKIGNNCLIGPGTIVDEDVEQDSLLYVKQQKIVKSLKE